MTSFQELRPEIYPAGAVKNEELRELLSAWHKVKENRQYPMDPTPILRNAGSLLSMIHVSDVQEDGSDFRFRLVGECVFPSTPWFQVGRTISEHPDPIVRFQFMTLMRATYIAGWGVRGVYLQLCADNGGGHRVESLWLPFGRSSIVEQVLGIAAAEPLTG